MITRRDSLVSFAAASVLPLLPACAQGNARPTGIKKRPGIEPGFARFLSNGSEPPLIETDGHYGDRPFTLDSPFRVASISKVLVAELIRRLSAQGDLNPDADISEPLNFTMRHPDFPNDALTLRRLVAHQSGIIDPDTYWVPAPGDIRSILTNNIWEPGVRPGAGFRYANLNYGIAATVIEARTGERFDRIFTDIIAKPLGLDVGFNWSGVSAEKRAQGFPCSRLIDGVWTAQVDDERMLASSGPAILSEPGWSLDNYRPGTNGTLFSPQGGLRASVNDLAAIGREVLLSQPDLARPIWTADALDSPSTENGHFLAFGDGVYIYDDTGPFPPRTYGHIGEAYGFYGGLWVAPSTQSVFVHARLGSPSDGFPMTGDVPNLTVAAAEDLDWARDNGF